MKLKCKVIILSPVLLFLIPAVALASFINVYFSPGDNPEAAIARKLNEAQGKDITIHYNNNSCLMYNKLYVMDSEEVVLTQGIKPLQQPDSSVELSDKLNLETPAKEGFLMEKSSLKKPAEKPIVVIPDLKIVSISNSWGPVSLDTTTINTEILVNDPNFCLIPIKVCCDIYLNDIKMVNSLGKDLQITKCASGSLIRFTGTIDNENIIKWWVSHIKNREKTKVRIEGTLIIPLAQVSLVYPFAQESEFETNMLKSLNDRDLGHIDIGLVKLGIDSLSSRWGKVSQAETQIVHKLTIHNFGILPLLQPLIDVKYKLILNGVEMAEGKAGMHIVFLPGQRRSVTFISKIHTKKMIKWWVSHINNGERTKYCLHYTLIWVGFIRTPKKVCGTFKTDIFSRNTWHSFSSHPQ